MFLPNQLAISLLVELKTEMLGVEYELRQRILPVPVELLIGLPKVEGLQVDPRGRLLEVVHLTNPEETASNAISLVSDASAKVP